MKILSGENRKQKSVQILTVEQVGNIFCYLKKKIKEEKLLTVEIFFGGKYKNRLFIHFTVVKRCNIYEK